MFRQHVAGLQELIQTLSGGRWNGSITIDPDSVETSLPTPQNLFMLGETLSLIPVKNLHNYMTECQEAFSMYDQSRKSEDKSALARLASSRSQGKSIRRMLPEYPPEFALDSVLIFIAVCETVVAMIENIDKLMETEPLEEDDVRLQKKLDKWITVYLQTPGSRAIQQSAESILQDERKALLA